MSKPRTRQIRKSHFDELKPEANARWTESEVAEMLSTALIAMSTTASDGTLLNKAAVSPVLSDESGKHVHIVLATEDSEQAFFIRIAEGVSGEAD